MSIDWRKEGIRCQKEWCRILHTWKYFENTDHDLIKTYIGIGLFGFTESESTVNLSLRHYYKNYSEPQRKAIQKIVDQLVSLGGPNIELGHTYLYLSENGIVCCIFRCRTKKTTFFIEPTGRAYNSWSHFLETSELPSCQFLAPKNGVYNKKAEIVCFQTPSSKRWLDKGQSVMDWVCAVAGVGCTLLGVFALAPGVVASTAIVVGVKNVHKSIANILDHQEHHQLATLNTVSSGISLASIALSALSGVSKSYEVFSLVGEQSCLALKVIQSLNIPGRLIDAGCFGTYLLHLCYRIRKGNVTNVDAVELAAQIFVLYGAVVDVERLHQVITRQRVNSRADLAVKFNDWKRRLDREHVRVKNCDPLVALKLLASRNPKISFKILRKFYSKNEVILNTCFDVEHSTLDFLCDRISINQYCVELRQLVVNLWTLLEEDFNQTVEIVRRFVFPHIDTDINIHCRDISKLLHAAIPASKEIEKVSTEEKLPLEKPLDTISEEKTVRHQVIIDSAKSLVTKSNHYNSTKHVITSCYEAILLTTSKLIDIITQTYNDIVAYNRTIVGEERLQMILERIHATTVDEYFHHDRAFSNAINKFKQENELSSDIDSSDNSLSDQLVLETTNEVMALYEDAYAVATQSLQLSLEDTMNTLQNISLSFNEKLLHEMDEMRQQNTTYSQMNSLLYEAASNEFLDVSELNELQILRKAKMRLNIEKVILPFQSSNEIEPSPVRRTTKDDYQMYEALLIICSNFYRKISNVFDTNNKSSKVTLLRKIYYFVISKFINTMETCSRDEGARNALKSQHQDYKLIYAICSSSESLFYAVLEKFEDDKYINELAAQFLNSSFDDRWVYNKIAIWKELIASNEFNLRCLQCSKYEPEAFYRTIASQLFDIEVNDQFEVVINEKSIFLKSLRKFITFNFITEDIALVISLNLRLN